jgi:uncharacterized membrane protein SpoIIM required for sporulation
MPELQLKSQRFREEREADWRRLEGLLRRVEQGSAASLTYDEMVALPRLYRAALSSLSVARAISLDHSVVDYLEGLSTRAYYFVYGVRSTLLQRLTGFFARAWPAAARGLWPFALVSGAVMLVGALAGYLLSAHDADWYYAFVPQELANGRDPAATTTFLRSTLYDDGGKKGLSLLATFLFTHNAQISLFAFALGFAFGVPTLLLMAYNGAMAGAFLELYAQHGLGFQAAGWLFIHGVTELLAVTLAGAAGLKLGWTLVFPGARSRVEAMAEAGRQAATLMAGVVVMLFIAGMLEGFARQLIKDDIARWTIAMTSLVVWLAYLYAPRRQETSIGRR